MDYQQELQAKLDAVRSPAANKQAHTLTTLSLEDQLVTELESELETAQYDLDESDILRSIKILNILNSYSEVFSHHKALTLFYALAKADIMQAKNLYRLSKLSLKEFKLIINLMAKHKLLLLNEEKELELTAQGQSLAERIGIDIFI